MEVTKREQKPSDWPDGQLLTNPLQAWDLSPGLLTLWPVLLQEAVLPLLL